MQEYSCDLIAFPTPFSVSQVTTDEKNIDSGVKMFYLYIVHGTFHLESRFLTSDLEKSIILKKDLEVGEKYQDDTTQ